MHVHFKLVNPLGGLSPGIVWLTDRLNMTIAVYHGHKQQHNNNSAKIKLINPIALLTILVFLSAIGLSRIYIFTTVSYGYISHETKITFQTLSNPLIARINGDDEEELMWPLNKDLTLTAAESEDPDRSLEEDEFTWTCKVSLK